jgi:radical SAM protein with 4Fe4S-binding SPASM domain
MTDKLITVNISLDGLEATHDKLRGEGMYRETVTTLKELKKIEKRVNNLEISVRLTVMDENVNEIYELYKKFGGDFEFFFKPCQFFPGDSLYEKGTQGSGLAISEETKKTLKEFVETVFLEKEFSGKNSLLDTIRKFFYTYQLEYMENPHIMPLPCTAGFSDFFIDYNGDLHGCGILVMNPFGNIRETPIDEVWNSKAASDFRKWLKKETCHCYTACHVYPSLATSKWKEIAYDYLRSKFGKT